MLAVVVGMQIGALGGYGAGMMSSQPPAKCDLSAAIEELQRTPRLEWQQ